MFEDKAGPIRRDVLRGGATLGLLAALSGCLAQVIPQDVGLALTPTDLTDPAVLNFALNLEYLEAEYYLRGTTGQGLDPADIGSAPGPVTGGRQVAFSDSTLRMFAEEIAADERAHVRFLRKHTINSPLTQTDRPPIDLQQSFRAVGQAAGLGADFDPFANEMAFFLGAFLFEDVGVSAYTGAARLIADKDLLAAAAGIQQVEAYHAGIIRTQLYMMGAQAQHAADAISAARQSLNGSAKTDAPLTQGDRVEVASADGNGLAFGRTPQQVLNIVYITPSMNADKGGFFPRGIKGVVQATGK